MTANCNVCAVVTSRFYKPIETHVIKATLPMERLSVDFKGTIAGCTKNRYMLTIIDEYSRFPFAFPCSRMDASTVIACLSKVFLLFGLCAFIHSDRGPAFMSFELQSFLPSKGIGVSRTFVYNPRGNGQCKKFNSTVWNAVQLALKKCNLPISKWDIVLYDALHAIRSLLCTATNETPHERFLKLNRRSMLGSLVPTWLHKPGPVLLKRHLRSSKYEPIVDKVELIHATPSYARVRLPGGREATVSLRDVAPISHKSELCRNFSETDDEFEPEFLFNRSDASNTVNRNVITPNLPETQQSTNSNDICDNSPVIDDTTTA